MLIVNCLCLEIKLEQQFLLWNFDVAAWLQNLGNTDIKVYFFVRCNRKTSGFAVTPHGK